MIIFDLSQIMLSNILSLTTRNVEIDESVVRFSTLRSIIAINKKYKREYGKGVLACDGYNSWRKKEFPFYKKNRKTNRDASGLDWSHIFSCMGKIREELRDNFPYTVILVDDAEADDVIATLVYRANEKIFPEQILIVSSDKDFIGLQKFENVKQFDPINKKMITSENPELFLKELILRGDAVDGIPNILSDDDTFIDANKRQNRLTAVKIEEYLREGIPDDLLKNYKRNETLINLEFIPDDVKNKIHQKIDEYTYKKCDITKYLMNNKLDLFKDIGYL